MQKFHKKTTNNNKSKNKELNYKYSNGEDKYKNFDYKNSGIQNEKSKKIYIQNYCLSKVQLGHHSQ